MLRAVLRRVRQSPCASNYAPPGTGPRPRGGVAEPPGALGGLTPGRQWRGLRFIDSVQQLWRLRRRQERGMPRQEFDLSLERVWPPGVRVFF